MYVSLPTFQFHKGTIKAILLLLRWLVLLLHFNSIKVQLKLTALDIRQQFIDQFQFHKGTIKAALLLLRLSGLRHFNSIKVQLKRFCISACDMDRSTFQFHKGTIKAHHLHVWRHRLRGFQFHKGTIKAISTKRCSSSRSDISIP